MADCKRPSRQRDRATWDGGRTKAIVRTAAAGRSRLGEGESRRTSLRASAQGVAALCFGNARLPESCKRRMLEFGEGHVRIRRDATLLLVM